jgi:hypothetical protein
MGAEDVIVWRNIAIIPVIVGVLQFLSITLCREWIKSDLRQKTFKPISVRWRPLTTWPVWGPAFRVLYEDADRFVHEAQCGLPAWHRPVVWRKDEVVDVA